MKNSDGNKTEKMKQLFPPIESIPSTYKLFISNYKLEWKTLSSAPLKGVLLAFDFGLGERGYSDFLPWPSFGEKALSQQLEELRKGKKSCRFEIAEYNAFLDAKARKEKQSLEISTPPNHYLIHNLEDFKDFKSLKGFSRVKVKLKKEDKTLQTEALKRLNRLFPPLKWRLDLNGGSLKGWHLDFLKIDFIEDPDPSSVKKLSLAAEDWLCFKKAPLRILKPGRDFVLRDLKKFLNKKRIVFTHSFDHPFGQAINAFWAGCFYKSYPQFTETGGLMDFHLKDLKNYPLKKEGLFLKAPKAYGFGFGDSLKKEKWEHWI